MPASAEAVHTPIDVAVIVDGSVTAWPAGSRSTPDAGAIPANLRREIYVTTLPADDAVSASRDTTAPAANRERLTLRTAPVYGVDADPITTFLIMMRSLPAVPLPDTTRRLQPLWHEDLASAIAACVSLDGAVAAVNVAGPDDVSFGDLYEWTARLIDRRPLRIAIPEFLLEYGATLADGLGLSAVAEQTHVLFQTQHEVLPPDANALRQTLGITPTPLAVGLRRLIHELGEITPDEGVGVLDVRRVVAEIKGSRYRAAELLAIFRANFANVMPTPVGVEPAAPDVELHEGGVVTMALPGRGHVQVRVEEITADHVIVATLRGHAVAGIVRFSATDIDGAVRFEVMPCDRAANRLDWLALTLGGSRLQGANWIRVVQNVVDLSGGHTDEITSDRKKLDEAEAERVERWIASVIDRRRARNASAAAADLHAS